MKPLWDDLIARARGLQSHLLTPGQLESVGRCGDLAALRESLRQAGIGTGEDDEVLRPATLELAVRRWAATLLHVLGRWAGTRSAVLPSIFADEERHSVRRLLRGASQHAEPEVRLAGLIPTPALPERALEELARAPNAAAVVASLSAWAHPFARELVKVVHAAAPDAFQLEAALARAWAEQARRAARESGDSNVRAWVTQSIDIENLVTGLILAGEGKDVVAEEHFLGGGSRLGQAQFILAIQSGSPAAALAHLAGCFDGSGLESCLHGAGAPAATLESDMLRARIRRTERQVARDPLGPLALLLFGMRLRAQVSGLIRLIWVVALGAPRSASAAALPMGVA